MPTELDIEAASGIADIMEEVGVPCELQVLDGNYDTLDGDVSRASDPISITSTPPVKLIKQLAEDAELSRDFSEGESRESQFVVYMDASALRDIDIDDIPLSSTVSVSGYSGSVVKVYPIVSGELIAAWKLVVSG